MYVGSSEAKDRLDNDHLELMTASRPFRQSHWRTDRTWKVVEEEKPKDSRPRSISSHNMVGESAPMQTIPVHFKCCGNGCGRPCMGEKRLLVRAWARGHSFAQRPLRQSRCRHQLRGADGKTLLEKRDCLVTGGAPSPGAVAQKKGSSRGADGGTVLDEMGELRGS